MSAQRRLPGQPLVVVDIGVTRVDGVVRRRNQRRLFASRSRRGCWSWSRRCRRSSCIRGLRVRTSKLVTAPRSGSRAIELVEHARRNFFFHVDRFLVRLDALFRFAIRGVRICERECRGGCCSATRDDAVIWMRHSAESWASATRSDEDQSDDGPHVLDATPDSACGRYRSRNQAVRTH
jgi:hypothetical protein